MIILYSMIFRMSSGFRKIIFLNNSSPPLGDVDGACDGNGGGRLSARP